MNAKTVMRIHVLMCIPKLQNNGFTQCNVMYDNLSAQQVPWGDTKSMNYSVFSLKGSLRTILPYAVEFFSVSNSIVIPPHIKNMSILPDVSCT